MARSDMTRERVIVRQSYYWPDWQLNIWIIIMLATGGTLVGIFANFVTIQNALGGLGIPWSVSLALHTLSICLVAEHLCACRPMGRYWLNYRL